MAVHEAQATHQDVTTNAAVVDETATAPAPVSVVEDAAEANQAEEAYPEPKGAWTFVLLLAAFYAFYWTMSYFEVFIFRGA